MSSAMSADEYEYERMRAELLGLPPPERKPPPQEDGQENPQQEDPPIDEQELDVEDEQMKNITGGLDELNSILTVTQKKLNKFKVVCGSLTNLLKIRIGKDESSASTCSRSCSRSLGSGAEAEKEEDRKQDAAEAEKKSAAEAEKKNPPAKTPEKGEKSVTSQRALNLADKITSQTDRLDAMIMKAEQAEMSLSHQNKQIKSFLR